MEVPSERPRKDPEASAAMALFDRLLAGPLHLPASDGPNAPTHAGPWALGEKIGKGGLSTVFDAVRPTPEGPERAALKLAKRVGDETSALFANEAWLLQRLQPPGVARLIDQGACADGRAYLALERVEGRGVAAVARTGSPWERLLLSWRVCRAVDALHQQGVVHGDLKPDHLIVRADGTVVVLDLGMARDLRGPAADDGRRLGITPEFAAPEQILGDAVGCPADVYALGLVVREVLEGRRRHVPWACGGDAVEALDVPDGEPDAAPGPSGDLIGRYVVEVLRTALQTDPARRYPTAGALARALDDVLDAVSEAPRFV